MKDLFNTAISKEIKDLRSKIDQLESLVFDETNIIYRAQWSDSHYHGDTWGSYDSKTLDGAFEWLASEDHPNSYSGCAMGITGYYKIKSGDLVFLQSYPVDDKIKEILLNKACEELERIQLENMERYKTLKTKYEGI